jgi:hypothetical protein
LEIKVITTIKKDNKTSKYHEMIAPKGVSVSFLENKSLQEVILERPPKEEAGSLLSRHSAFSKTSASPAETTKTRGHACLTAAHTERMATTNMQRNATHQPLSLADKTDRKSSLIVYDLRNTSRGKVSWAGVETVFIETSRSKNSVMSILALSSAISALRVNTEHIESA